MTKIRLLLPYYGNWPVYLELFLKSLEKNPIIEAALITDLNPPKYLPANCEIIHLSLEDLHNRAISLIAHASTISHPYKLCDYKPAYAELLPDLVKGYSYWAFGDLDLIYGNVSSCLPCDWTNFDILTFRREWISGSFTILANNSFVNNLFRRSKSFPWCYSTPLYTGFDECFNLFDQLIGKTSDTILDLDTNDSFGYLVRQASANGLIKLFQETKIKESIPARQLLHVSPTGIRDREFNYYLLYHYITEKKSLLFELPEWKDLPGEFTIDRFGFRMHDLSRFAKYSRLLYHHSKATFKYASLRLTKLASRL